MNPLKKLRKESKNSMSLPDLLRDLENDFLYEIQHIPVYENKHRKEIKYFEDSVLEGYLEEGKKLYRFSSYVLLYAATKALKQLVFDIEAKKPLILEVLAENVEEDKSRFKSLSKDYDDLLAEYKPPFPKSKVI